MSLQKLKEIESLLLDVIIYCTDEAECEQDVIEELHSLKERIYKLERRIPNNETDQEIFEEEI